MNPLLLVKAHKSTRWLPFLFFFRSTGDNSLIVEFFKDEKLATSFAEPSLVCTSKKGGLLDFFHK